MAKNDRNLSGTQVDISKTGILLGIKLNNSYFRYSIAV